MQTDVEATPPEPLRRPSRLGWALAGLGLLALVAAIVWSTVNGRRADALWDRARAASIQERWDEVGSTLDQLRAIRPLDRVQNRLRVQAALRLRDADAALAALAHVSPDDSEYERAQMTRGRLLMEKFRYRDAAAVFRRCLAANPRLEEAHVQLVILTGMKRQADAFERQLWDYFDKTEWRIAALRMLSRGIPFLPSRTTVDPAHDEGHLLEQGLAADPADPDIRPALARYYLTRGEVDKALPLLEAWLEMDPDDPLARVEWVACLLEQGRTDEAAPYLDPVPDQLARSARFWGLRGEFLKRRGDYDGAVEAFRRAVDLEPRNPEARFRLGQALRAAGRGDEAEPFLTWVQKANQLVALMKNAHDTGADPALLAQAGDLCREMGRLREARGWYQAAAKADPQNADVARRLADLTPH
jgi:tetratricopeptide (TPR) repeat protein